MPEKPFRLAEAPLVHVLAQVIFDPYLNIGKHIPDLQERLRGQGFLDVKQVEQPQVVFEPEGGKVSFAAVSQWQFLTKDRRTVLAVTPSGVVLQTNLYDHFDPFGKLVVEAVSAVNDFVPDGRKIRKRLGLRYVNLILPKDEEVGPEQFVHPSLLGMSVENANSELSFRRVESYFVRTRGVLAIRYADIPEQSLLPPGLDPAGMAPPRESWEGKRFGLLDIDRYWERDVDFQLESLGEDLQLFNREVEEAFRRACTPAAFAEWKVK